MRRIGLEQQGRREGGQIPEVVLPYIRRFLLHTHAALICCELSALCEGSRSLDAANGNSLQRLSPPTARCF